MCEKNFLFCLLLRFLSALRRSNQLFFSLADISGEKRRDEGRVEEICRDFFIYPFPCSINEIDSVEFF